MTRKPTRSLISLSAILALATLFAPPAAWAAPITVPTDLNPGDHYRLAFVTSTTRDATSADIADYNAFVTAAANSVPDLLALGTTWTAIGSTAAVDARDNTGTNPTMSTGVPIYRLDDTRIANNNADLWDATLIDKLDTVEDGGPAGLAHPASTLVWTGTRSDGTVFSTAGLGGASGTSAAGGFTSATSHWVVVGFPQLQILLPLYAISAELTVVPEPGTMILACVGAAALAGCMLRRRVHRKRGYHNTVSLSPTEPASR